MKQLRVTLVCVIKYNYGMMAYLWWWGGDGVNKTVDIGLCKCKLSRHTLCDINVSTNVSTKVYSPKECV